MRKIGVGIGLALVVAAAVALTVPGGRETAKVAAGFVGVVDDPPFRLQLGGPLWRDRSLRGGDGAQDFAQVARDEPLNLQIRGSGKARVAQVELRVDGRRERSVEPRCVEGGCPTSLSVTFVPGLRRLGPGDHRIQLVARDSRARESGKDTGPHVSVVEFHVRTVARVPPTIEGNPVGNQPRAPDTAGLERSALRVLAAERRSPGLAAALGAARVTVIFVGNLNVKGQRLGATMLVQLVPPRHNVRATVPDYVPTTGRAGAPYTRQRVRMHAKALQDVLIDVDLSSQRLIAFEPGPRSETLSWSPSTAPAPAGAADED
jgi:hypothetical protein